MDDLHRVMQCSSETTLRECNEEGASNKFNPVDDETPTMVLHRIADLRLLLNAQMWSCDAKLLIFSAAAFSDNYRSLLVPIPPLFMGETGYDIDRLRHLVSRWPSCRLMLHHLRTGYLETNVSDIYLLYWVLVWQAHPFLCRLPVARLRRLCETLRLQHPVKKPSSFLSVGQERAHEDAQRSVNGNGNDNGRQFAYMGCNLCALYRFLAMGKLMQEDVSATLMLYANPELALAHSVVVQNWQHSRYGCALRCLVICELLMPSNVMQVGGDQMEFIVSNTDGLCPRYLLIYSGVPAPLPAGAAMPTESLQSVASGGGPRKRKYQRERNLFGILFDYLGSLAARAKRRLLSRQVC
ncbi:uncharacterized protein LOC115626786 [Scaptodrosophila lebanonensis]|uniref:Uncharacterized protein LOC115626786 n=1 Tax=Drosophila lebanonensis TaxID=7225 RepID=A0A6J2TT65_DROLE|nr:uncharacterized protein LOC115626786 [Scaptodrosophila lebanonensis]